MREAKVGPHPDLLPEFPDLGLLQTVCRPWCPTGCRTPQNRALQSTTPLVVATVVRGTETAINVPAPRAALLEAHWRTQTRL